MEYILYFSRAKSHKRVETLDDILASARRNNPALGLTGLLLYGEGMFVQVLEGPSEPVAMMFERIKNDPRHGGAVVMSQGRLEQRQFPDWSMGARVIDPTLPGYSEVCGSSSSDLEERLGGIPDSDMLEFMRKFYSSSVRAIDLPRVVP